MIIHPRLLRPLLAASVLIGMASVAGAETVKVGVTGGPHAQIFEQVAALAKKDGIDVKVLEFDDYQIPNAALSQGDLDLNSFQHQPFLDNQVRDRGYKLTAIGRTVIFPIGLYSKTVKSLAELKDGDKVAIPNDPTNGGRVLLLLQAQGLLKIRSEAGLKATPLDVTDNLRKLKLIELPAAQLARSLDDVAVAAVNGNYALEVGLNPQKDAIALESVDSPYANVIAVRSADKDKPVFAKLVKLYQSSEVKAFIKDKFGASVVPAF